MNLSVPPALLTQEDMWTPVLNRRTGEFVQLNILTKEKVDDVLKYDGAGIKKMKELQVFQPETSSLYRKRKIWLSICQVHEWVTELDPEKGILFFRNNISGELSWQIPHSLDALGGFPLLEELDVKMNSLKSLPSSIVQVITLKRLILSFNTISALPEDIGKLVNLEFLDLTTNELRILPRSITECVSLQILLLNDNQLIRLPSELGRLPQLKKLDLVGNHLQQVPSTLGFCETLETIFITNNPIVDPPMEEFNKPIDTLKWYLRNRYLIETRGMPPLMTFHHIGIQDQVTILIPEFEEIVSNYVDASKSNGFLDLQLLGLKFLPPAVLEMQKLKTLRLDFNDKLDLTDGFPVSLKSLIRLSLRACKMYSLPENIHLFEKLESLKIHENRLESIAIGITELRTLTLLGIVPYCMYATSQ